MPTDSNATPGAGESNPRQVATELDVERHVPAPSIADVLTDHAALLALDNAAALVAAVVSPDVVARARRAATGLRPAALLDLAATRHA